MSFTPLLTTLVVVLLGHQSCFIDRAFYGLASLRADSIIGTTKKKRGSRRRKPGGIAKSLVFSFFWSGLKG